MAKHDRSKGTDYLRKPGTHTNQLTIIRMIIDADNSLVNRHFPLFVSKNGLNEQQILRGVTIPDLMSLKLFTSSANPLC